MKSDTNEKRKTGQRDILLVLNKGHMTNSLSNTCSNFKDKKTKIFTNLFTFS